MRGRSTTAREEKVHSKVISITIPQWREKAEKLLLSGLKGHTGGIVLCSGLVIVLIVC